MKETGPKKLGHRVCTTHDLLFLESSSSGIGRRWRYLLIVLLGFQLFKAAFQMAEQSINISVVKIYFCDVLKYQAVIYLFVFTNFLQTVLVCKVILGILKENMGSMVAQASHRL